MQNKTKTYELIVGGLVSKDKVSWGVRAVTRDESVALRQVSMVSGVIEGLDSTRSNITIAWISKKKES